MGHGPGAFYYPIAIGAGNQANYQIADTFAIGHRLLITRSMISSYKITLFYASSRQLSKSIEVIFSSTTFGHPVAYQRISLLIYDWIRPFDS